MLGFLTIIWVYKESKPEFFWLLRPPDKKAQCSVCGYLQKDVGSQWKTFHPSKSPSFCLPVFIRNDIYWFGTGSDKSIYNKNRLEILRYIFDAQPKLHNSPKSYAVKLPRFPIFPKTVGGRGEGHVLPGRGEQQIVTFPGNFEHFSSTRGQFPPMWRLPSPRFSAKTDILLVWRPGAGRSQVAGAGLSEQTAVWPGAGREMSYLL